MKWYLKVLQNYFKFSGRARRSEYWYFFLFNLIIIIILNIIDAALSLGITLTAIYDLAVLIPAIAVGVRRMHDTNRSGWFILIPLVNIVFACMDGTPGENKYGPDPKNEHGFDASDYERPFDINAEN